MAGPFALKPNSRIFIAGHRGLVGSALVRHFTAQGFDNLILRTADELDLRDEKATAAFLNEAEPDIVIDAAGRVGGIGANFRRPADFLSDNLRIQVNLLDSAVEHGVSRFLFLGSSCIYPKHAAQPILETALLTGPLEPTNGAYAMAKLTGIAHVIAIRQQYGLPYISAMPTNLYGPGDNFNLENGHVLPAMIRRFDEAARDKLQSVTCWGSGTPRREFLYVDDFAEACHHLLEHYDDDTPINVGSGHDLTIAELAALTAGVTGYTGQIVWNADKPDGTPAKLIDSSRINHLGWKATTPLADGIAETYRWYVDHLDDCRH